MAFAILLLGIGTSRVAADEDPIKMLKTVTDQVTAELRAHGDNNPQRVYKVVERLVLPHVDFAEMARWVVGRNAWNSVDEKTQQTFIREFRTMVVRNYARSLLKYTDQEIEFLPLRSSGGSRIQVSSIVYNNGSEIHMNYRLVKHGNSWMVYDIIVEGVSLMQGYRSQFAQDIESGGVAAAIRTMQGRNNNNGYDEE